MFFDKENIFDTPRLRYYQLKEEFEGKYLNPKAWDFECDTKEIIQAYQDLLDYLEKTDQFRNVNRSLYNEIPTDNVNLVVSYLPFPPKRREELIEFLVSGNSSELCQEEELHKIKKFFEMKKRGSLVGFERRSRRNIMNRRYAANDVVNDDEDKFAEEAVDIKKHKRSEMEYEILEVRQKLYSKLNEGRNVFKLMKKFRRKVDIFLGHFKADLSYVEQKHWRDKVIITEKAINRFKKESKLQKEYCSRKEENVAPSVKELFDAARAQEILIENLPVPLEVDEIEEKLERLKEFNKNLLEDKNETAAKEDIKVKADRMENVKVDKNDKKDDLFDVDEFLGKNLVWRNDDNAYDEEESEDEAFDTNIEENVEEECTKSKVNTEFKNEKPCVDESEEQYKAEVKEFNDWYYRKLEERKHNVKVDDNTTKLFDKVVRKKSNIEEEMHNDLMYKQLFDCNEKEVGKETNGYWIVALLQAIFALLLVCGKSLHEQSVKINHLSKLSQPSLLSHLQPEALLFPKSPCSCQTKPRVCCEVTDAFSTKVSSMVSTASSGVLWCKRVYSALECVKMKTVRAAKVRLVNLLGLGEVILELANEDY